MSVKRFEGDPANRQTHTKEAFNVTAVMRRMRLALHEELGETIPDFAAAKTKNQLTGTVLYYRDNPRRVTSAIYPQFGELLRHPIQDVRHHTSEAVGSVLTVSQAPQRFELIDTARLAPPDELDEHAVNALHFGKIAEDEAVFPALPAQVQVVLQARKGNLDPTTLREFLTANPQWQADILESVGKYTPQLPAPILDVAQEVEAISKSN